MIRTHLCLALAAVCVAFATCAPASAEPTQDELKARFKERHAAILKLKTAAKAGETTGGYLEALTPAAAGEAAVKTLVDAENQDRQQLYALLARQENTTAQDVARQNAIRTFTMAGPDEYFKGKDGAWRKKSEMLK